MKFFDTLLAAMKMAPEEARKVLGLDKVDPEGKLEVTGSIELPRGVTPEEVMNESFGCEGGLLRRQEWFDFEAMSQKGTHSRFQFVTFAHPSVWNSPEYVGRLALEVLRILESGDQKVRRMCVTVPDIVGIMSHFPGTMLSSERTNNLFFVEHWYTVEHKLEARSRVDGELGLYGAYLEESCGSVGWSWCLRDNFYKHGRVHRLFFPDLP